VTSQRIKSINCGLVYVLNKKKRKQPAGQSLCVFRLAFKLLSYNTCIILNAIPGSLRKPFDGPLHHRLQGDAAAVAPEAHKHVVSHHRCQGAALLL
jgi:hypothetical protein